MFKEISILKSHGIQYVPHIDNVELTPLFRGRPEISEDISEEEYLLLGQACPTQAIGFSDALFIDLGKCIFCGECTRTCKKISFTNDYRIATNVRGSLIIKAGQKDIKIDNNYVRPEVKKLFNKALKLRQVSAAGDNACEMELNAAGNVNFDMGRFGIDFLASPRHCDGIVITGPISENMAKPLQICFDAIPSPKIIILVGTEAISGGIFADSNEINRSFLDNYNIDLYIPGNPTHPLSFINGVLDLIK